MNSNSTEMNVGQYSERIQVQKETIIIFQLNIMRNLSFVLSQSFLRTHKESTSMSELRFDDHSMSHSYLQHADITELAPNVQNIYISYSPTGSTETE